MTRIVLTPEQTAAVKSATEPVEICCSDGTIAGWISSTGQLPPERSEPRPETIAEAERSLDDSERPSPFVIPKVCPFTPEEIAAAEKEAEGPGPWYSTKEVLDYLRSLDSQ